MLKDTLKLCGLVGALSAAVTFGGCIGTTVSAWVYEEVLEDALNNAKNKINNLKKKKES